MSRSKKKSAVSQPSLFAPPEIKRDLGLDPADWYQATWRDLPPLPCPDPEPFDLKDCVARLSKVTVRGLTWAWHKANLTENLSVEEARFWYAATTGARRDLKPRELALYLGRQSFEESPTLEAIKRKLQTQNLGLPPCAMLAIKQLAPLEDIVRTLFVHDAFPLVGRDYTICHRNLETHRGLLVGFGRHVFPYLSGDEKERLKSCLPPALELTDWAECLTGRAIPLELRLAARLGTPEQMLEVVQKWHHSATSFQYGMMAQVPHEIVFGLGSADLVREYMERLQLRLRNPEHVRAWLAHTELAGLDLIRASIQQASAQEKLDLIEAFCRVRAPELAPHMLEMKLQSSVPTPFRRWLDENPGNAIAGLLPLAGGRRKLADEAREHLRSAYRLGHGEFLEEQLLQLDGSLAGKIRREVIEQVDRAQTFLDESTTPDWLQNAVEEELTSRRPRVPDWIRLADLPVIQVGDYCLNEDQVLAVLAALRKSTLTEPHPFVMRLKTEADPVALDAFVWKLFEWWNGERAPSDSRWAFHAVGLLGGDASVLKLAPIIRNWPGQRQHKRAVQGLECLRAIGTDTALMQLHSIGQKQGKSLQTRAQELLFAIATERSLSTAQLEDRIVPDLGLDARGSRTFDFGPRQFQFVLGPGLKPLVRDDKGKLKSDLPKPGVKDDPERAETAVREWKLLKAQIKEVVKAQVYRLEQAMIHGRRWSPAEFETYLVHHPLMVNLARLLLWGGFTGQGQAGGQLERAFRITEEGEYADQTDASCSLKGLSRIGIVHPLHLSDEARAIWGQILGDYEIIALFPQLGRRFHRLDPGERTALEIRRFAGKNISMMIALGILKRHGWTDGYYSEGGTISGPHKPYPGAGTTAVIELNTRGVDSTQIQGIYFHPGLPGLHFDPTRKVPLGEVDPVVVSEVLGTAGVLVSRAP